ncbi:MAG: hypothetical protein ACJ75G_13330 [Gaiellaceae bacterium]
MVVSWARYLGSAVGFGFGVVWMTAGLGAAIVSLLLAALGYGIVFLAERARANAATHQPANETLHTDDGLLPIDDEFKVDHRSYYEPSGDETTPLAAEAEYGWARAYEAIPRA